MKNCFRHLNTNCKILVMLGRFSEKLHGFICAFFAWKALGERLCEGSRRGRVTLSCKSTPFSLLIIPLTLSLFYFFCLFSFPSRFFLSLSFLSLPQSLPLFLSLFFSLTLFAFFFSPSVFLIRWYKRVIFYATFRSTSRKRSKCLGCESSVRALMVQFSQSSRLTSL